MQRATKSYYRKKTKISQRLIPQYDAKPAFCRKIRYFQSSAVIGGVVTSRALLRLMVSVHSGSTTLVPLMAAVRIKAVKLWSASVAASTTLGFSTVRVQWLGTFTRAKEISDSGNATYPAHISTTPPPDSDASFWLSFDTDMIDNEIFQYDLPQGGILDLTIEYTLVDGATSQGTLTASSTPAFDGLAYLCLNNATTAGAAGLQTTQPIANQSIIIN